ncbi:MAG: hypothetical protein HFI76_15220 [Lachnospiraceae bacterium]|nr:hypothetical protein [Lachnospiraceae bacterium]
MANDLKWYQNHVLWRRLHVRRKYKDRLFRLLFQDKKDLLELYNAVNGSAYGKPQDLELITLDDVIFMKMKNDVSFIVADQINLYEQQSTYSSNMPLRGLFYFSRQYEGFIARQKHNLYGSKLVKLPTPQYVVFYNGKKDRPDQEELLLSDAYEAGRGSGCLECKALLLNINRGHNKELLEKCRRLWEYSEFVAEVNENLKQGMMLKLAVVQAMEDCIQRGILEDILIKNKAEVLHMLLTEYDEKKHMRDTYKEGEEEGYKRGKQEGYRKGKYAQLELMVRKKLQRGQSVATIAEALEEGPEVIEKIIDQMKPL